MCNWPIGGQGGQTHYPSMPSYPSMQLANHRPGKLDTLSQHAMETNHRSEKLDKLSQHTQHRHALPAYTTKCNLYKRGCKSPEQQTSLHSKITVQLEEPEEEEQQSK